MPDYTITSNNLGRTVVDLAGIRDEQQIDIFSRISGEIEAIHKNIQDILHPLKSELIKIKTDNQSNNKTEFDLSPHWDLIEKFKDNYNKLLIESGKDPKEDFGAKEYEKSKKVSIGELEKLLHDVTNTVDDEKFKLQQQNQALITHSHLSLNLYEALHRTLVLVLQGQERIAQKTAPR